ncbi:pyridoxal phosphate-dependent decarboxylase family protein [Legionella dresdenensis]|uniref:Pyridoxal phosphate-dependent decarboxylase family protein n=1 Tax=Legionella dresdenensis TaxID=450200 RepID=A0ABV8CG13_9GAMM
MLKFITALLSASTKKLDKSLKNIPTHQIILATAAILFLFDKYPMLARMYRSRHNSSVKQSALDVAYGIFKNLPPLKQYINKELAQNISSINKELQAERANMRLKKELPEESVPAHEILQAFGIEPAACNYDFSAAPNKPSAKKLVVQKGDGQDSGTLYAVHTEELTALLKETFASTALSNPMHNKWPRISAMRSEITQWALKLFGGSEHDYGLLTHGGTTSIIEAMAAYVIAARNRGIAQPEIVIPETAHAAFKKAAQLTGATLITVPVDPKTGAVSAKTMEKYLSDNTAVMVGSAPSFMYGICDPISELSELALRKKIPFHVDACLGGFLTAFADTSANPMDFRLPGVTSISADFHKYGLCPKGTSICMFRSDAPALPVFSAADWAGGLYATPGILDGSTSGARIAEIYTTMSYYGHKKYREITNNIVELRKTIQGLFVKLTQEDSGLTENDIYIFGDPQWSVLGFRSANLNCFSIMEEMKKRGWELNALQNPDGFHMCLTHVHTLMPDFAKKFIEDLQNAVAAVKKYGKDHKPANIVKVYGKIKMMPNEVQQRACVDYEKARLFFHADVPGVSSGSTFTPQV